MLELSKREVGGPHRCPTLLPRDTQPDVSLLRGNNNNTVQRSQKHHRIIRSKVHQIIVHFPCGLDFLPVPFVYIINVQQNVSRFNLAIGSISVLLNHEPGGGLIKNIT